MDTYTKDTEYNKGTVALFFTGQYCGYCKMVKPGIEKVASENRDKFASYLVDTGTDAGMDLAKEMSIKGLPTIIVFKDGVEQHRLVGMGQVQPHTLLSSVESTNSVD